MTTYLYLHGFGSGPSSKKAVELREAFAARGFRLLTPDLAVPTFAELTFTAALAVIAEIGREAAARGDRLAIVGSSMGGFLGATHAARHPDQVSGLVLLCPGFDMAARFRGLIGERGMIRWRQKNRIAYPDADNKLTAVHYGLYEDAQRYDPFPAPPPDLPVTIVHGIHDTVVPIDVSRSYVARHPQVQLVALDDDHRLHASVSRVFDVVSAAFDLPLR